jgi:hypothetical protein
MYDEKVGFNNYIPKTMNLHYISKHSEFVIYLSIKKPKNIHEPQRKINVIVNTGLYGKKTKINKDSFEREVTFTLRKLLTKTLFCNLTAINSISFYVVIIKNSTTTKFECLKCTFLAIRDLMGKNGKIVSYKNFFSSSKHSFLYQPDPFRVEISRIYWMISILSDLYENKIVSIFSEGLISIDFFNVCIFYIGNLKWYLGFKRTIA